MNVKKRMIELTKILHDANHRYYVLDAPVISDLLYDQYLRELNELENAYPEYKEASSPTARVGGKVLESFRKVTHETPMLSLANAFDKNDIYEFEKRLSLYHPTYLVELKIDGLAVSLTYEKGRLVQAATRGDGVVGEDVTDNIKTIKSIPLVLTKEEDIVVRGEIYMSKESFEELNNENRKKNIPLFANPRNAAAGTIRQLDSKVVASRNLSAFMFTILAPDKYHIETQEESLQYLKRLGFAINPHAFITSSPQEIIDRILHYDEFRKSLPYETDGMVIKVNQLWLYSEVGQTSKFPRWAIAYKFTPESVETRLNTITFQVGRTGIVTPVANFDPVVVSGSVIARATLHNEDYISEKDIREGDYVIVRKAGEIIPEIVEVVLSKRNGQIPFTMVTHCPVCGSQLVKDDSKAGVYCLNFDCESKNINKLIHYASRKAAGIDSLGEKNIEELYLLGYLKDTNSIYSLHEKQMELEKIPGFGVVSVGKILQSINKSRKIKLEKLIFGLGINQVGERNAQILANHFKSLEGFKKSTVEEMLTIHDIGPVIAQNIFEYFTNEASLKKLNLLEAELQVVNVEENKIPLKLQGKSFVITGKLSNYTRDELKKHLENLGAVVTNGVSKKTNYLIVGENAGSKYEQAVKLGIEIIQEDDVEQILN